MQNTYWFRYLFLATLFVVLAACSNNSSEEELTDAESEETASEAGSEFPVTVEHAFGETVIESKPERVATIQWGNQDVALALDVVPVGFSAANFGVQDDSGVLPWTAEKLDELGETNPNVFRDTDGLDFEAISDSNPDVILAAYSGITEEDYNTLSEIAPVVAYPEAAWATNWKDAVTYNAMGMGMQEEGEQLISDIQSSLDTKVAEYPQLQDKSIVWVNFSADDLSSLHIYTPIDARVDLLYDLGMTYPEELTNLIDDPESYSLTLSSENAEALNNADIIVGYGNQELLETLQDDSLLGSIPAIERGSVAFIEADSPIVAAGTPNPLSIDYTIDEYLDLLAGAADSANED